VGNEERIVEQLLAVFQCGIGHAGLGVPDAWIGPRGLILSGKAVVIQMYAAACALAAIQLEGAEQRGVETDAKKPARVTRLEHCLIVEDPRVLSLCPGLRESLRVASRQQFEARILKKSL
jgi:hypothetical protein